MPATPSSSGSNKLLNAYVRLCCYTSLSELRDAHVVVRSNWETVWGRELSAKSTVRTAFSHSRNVTSEAFVYRCPELGYGRNGRYQRDSAQ